MFCVTHIGNWFSTIGLTFSTNKGKSSSYYWKSGNSFALFGKWYFSSCIEFY